MARAGRTYRIFVSSTFTDLKAERNALQKHVFPRLRALCHELGSRFQEIDLRWGVSELASLDQRTMTICLEEVARCQRTTPRPNFVVLLGDRYGWCPLPSEIPDSEFQLVSEQAGASEEDRRLLATWYPRRDDNAVPPMWRLKPREREGPESRFDEWSDRVERPLRSLLLRACPSLPPARRRIYEASATEREILAGALGEAQEEAGGGRPAIRNGAVPDPREHVFAFLRRIPNLPQGDKSARGFVDLDAEGAPDRVAQDSVRRLRNELRDRLGDHVRTYEARWIAAEGGCGRPDRACARAVEGAEAAVRGLLSEGRVLEEDAWRKLEKTVRHAGRTEPAPRDPSKADGDRTEAPDAGEISPITLDHLPGLCVDVFVRLARVILQEDARLAAVDPLVREREAHRAFGEERARHFVGRTESLRLVEAYLAGLAGEKAQPLTVYGESGSGKTAFLAKAAEHAARQFPGGVRLVRYIGATPESTEGRSLLRSLCLELSATYERSASDTPEEFQELIPRFSRLLRAATADRPLFLFLDALDTLSSTDRARHLAWIPSRLPPHVRIVLSTTPGDVLDAVRKRFAESPPLPLEPLTVAEGGRILDRWLEEAGRTLQEDQRLAVLEAFRACPLPLYLKLAFEAVRELPSWEAPPSLPSSAEGLIEALFARLSSDVHHGPALVSHSLGYLAAARHGLTEDEMLDLLSRDDVVMDDFRRRSPESPPVNRIPVVLWSRLYHDLEAYLGRRSADGTSLLTFYHPIVKRCVQKQFRGAGRARHAALAEYFEGQLPALDSRHGEAPNLRLLSELPHQQTSSDRWKSLTRTLASLSFLQAKVEAGLGYDALGDLERARTRLSEVRDPGDPALEGTVALLDAFAIAFTQEFHAFQRRPETTAQQLFQNLFAQDGFDGPTGNILERYTREGSVLLGRSWLRRLNRAPRTSTPRALLRTIASHDRPVSGLAVSPGGKWIASGDDAGWVRVWTASDGSPVVGFEAHPGEEGSPAGVAGLTWVRPRDGRLLLTSAGRDGRVILWDWEAERREELVADVGSRLRCIAAIGSTLLAFGGDERVVRLWNLTAGREDPRPLRHRDRVLSVAVGAGDRLLVSGGADRILRVRPLKDGAVVPLRGHEREVWSVAVDPDRAIGVSAGGDGTVRTWDLERRRPLRVARGHQERVLSVAVLPRRGLIVSGGADETIRLWDSETLEAKGVLRAHRGAVTALAADPKTEWFVSGGDDGTLRVWKPEIHVPEATALFEHTDRVRALAELRAPDLVASASDDGTVALWGPNGIQEATLRGHTGPVTCLLGGRDHIVSGGGDGTVRRWPLSGGNPVVLGDPRLAVRGALHGGPEAVPFVAGGGTAPSGHLGGVTCLARVEEGRVASGGEDGTVRIWDLERRSETHCFGPAAGSVTSLISLGSRVVASGSQPELVLCDLLGGQEDHLAGHQGPIHCLARLGPDRVASGGQDATVRIWSVPGHLLETLEGHAARVNCLVAILPSRAGEASWRGVLASGSDDGTVRVWYPGEPYASRALHGHDGPVRVLAVAPKAGLFASGGDDGRVNLWNAPEGAPAATVSLGSPITALVLGRDRRLWIGTRSATVSLFRLC